jgi:LPXTG-site transpeptidase (sortase) family protein
MKTSVAIIVSLVVGALVTSAVVARGSQGQASSSDLADAKVMPAASKPDPAPAVRKSASGRATLEPRISIPRLRLKAEIGTDLDRGPAWWPITGRPGGRDTVAIAGHRTTHTRPFYWLERIQPGDRIYVRWQGRVHAYRMSGRRIVSAKNMHIGDARGHELLLLTACTPRGSARQRIVVYAWPALKGTPSRS